jgi:hypothetical protein
LKQVVNKSNLRAFHKRSQSNKNLTLRRIPMTHAIAFTLKRRARLIALTLLISLFSGLTLSASATDPAPWDGAIDVSWYIGHESEATFSISTAAELAGFAALVNGIAVDDQQAPILDSGKGIGFSGKTINLTADLDLGGTVSDGVWSGKVWQEIGATASAAHGSTASDTLPATTNAAKFLGTFNGQGHTIANIYIPRYQEYDNNAIDNGKGLFGLVGIGANIRNIGIISGSVSGARYVGGIAGANAGIIENCWNGATIISNAQRGSGGIAGVNYVSSYSDKSQIIRNCYNIGEVITTSTAGGGHGQAGGITSTNEGIVDNCFNFGIVTAPQGANFGDIVGVNSGGTVTNSSSHDISNWYTGTTTFSIGTAAELAGFAAVVNSGLDDFEGKTINLTADVRLAEDGLFTTETGLFGSGNYKMSATYYIFNGTQTTFGLQSALELRRETIHFRQRLSS